MESVRSQGEEGRAQSYRRPPRGLDDPPHEKTHTRKASGWRGLALGGGRPLDPNMRARMEHGLGTRLPDLRIHTGPEAAGLADRESARAVTFGNDIAFGSGEFQPGSLAGDALLAHEAAHSLQQSRGNGTLSESEAESGASRASGAAASRIAGSSGGRLCASESSGIAFDRGGFPCGCAGH